MMSLPEATNGSVATALHPCIVLGAYLEPLLRGRRVAVFGSALMGLAERLMERGVRLVHVYDPQPGRVAEALARTSPASGPHPSFAVLQDDLGVRDGAFDALIIPDLSMFSDPTDILRRARRLTSPQGVAIVSIPNPDATRSLLPRHPNPLSPLTYYALYDLVSLQFKVVRMIGQAPFVGYTIADFAPEGEPEVSVDTSLLSGSEEPEWFIAVASERRLHLDSFTVVELPLLDVGWSPPQLAQESGLVDVKARVVELEAELLAIRAKQERDQTEATSARVAEVERLLELEKAHSKEIETKAGDEHVRAERLSHQIRDLEEELRSQRDRAARLSKQLDDEKKAHTKVELELAMIRNKPELAGARDRLDAMGAELEVARARVAELEQKEANTQVSKSSSTEAALILRVDELQAAVATAKRELARVTAERDEALAKIKEFEQHAALQTSGAVSAIQTERDELKKERDAAREQIQRLEREIGVLEEQWATLETQKLELDEKVGRLEQRDFVDTPSAEVQEMEAALRERGQLIASLRAQLYESERVGKELVDQLGALFEASYSSVEDSEPVDQVDGPEALRQKLDSLAQTTAKREADLQAANWRIAQLDRELAEAREAAEATASHIDAALEQALVAAREEISLLRGQKVAAELDVSPDVVEQAVLLQQVAAHTTSEI